MWDEAAAVIREDGQDAEGSQGQRVLHPAIKTMQWLDSAIFAIEKELGLTPKARATLGLAVNQYKKSAADLIDDIRSLPPVTIED
jgi:P27 family predicted phage terminase small subunit